MTFGLALLFVAIGIASGVLSGLLGLGGGIVIVPALVAIFNGLDIDQDIIMHLATGTSLAVVMFTTSLATWSQHKRQAVRWSLLRYIIPGMVMGAILGVWLGKLLPVRILYLAFSLFCLVTAAQLLLARQSVKSLHHHHSSHVILLLITLLAGLLAGLLGIGGGAILIPILIWYGLPMPVVSGTSAASAFPTAMTGAITAVFVGIQLPNLPVHSLGYVYWPAVLLISMGSLIAVPAGVALAHILPEKIVKRIFAIILLFIAWQIGKTIH